MGGEETIICYKGSIEALSNYIFHPETGRLIEAKDDYFFVRSENVFTEEFNEIYKSHGNKIELKKLDFDKLFEKCEKVQKKNNKIKDLAKELFSGD